MVILGHNHLELCAAIDGYEPGHHSVSAGEVMEFGAPIMQLVLDGIPGLELSMAIPLLGQPAS